MTGTNECSAEWQTMNQQTDMIKVMDVPMQKLRYMDL